ncbi:MAG: hypothetical protein LIP01_02275 [Tannerellaceae bacterium]|nr:hypothetical protein [Tannerellaceae bacterium]
MRDDSIVYRYKVEEIPITLPLTNWQRFWVISGVVAWLFIILLMFYKGNRFFRKKNYFCCVLVFNQSLR